MTVLPRVLNFCFFKGEWNGTVFSTSLVWTKSLKASVPNSSTLRIYRYITITEVDAWGHRLVWFSQNQGYFQPERSQPGWFWLILITSPHLISMSGYGQGGVHSLWLGAPLLHMKTIQSISALNVKWINEISKSLAQFCDVLSLCCIWANLRCFVNGVIRVVHTCHFKSACLVTHHLWYAGIFLLKATIPPALFTWWLIVCSMVMSMGLHDRHPGIFDWLTLSAPFLRISSGLGWATCRFRRDVVHRKVPGIVVVMIHHKVKRTHFLQAWDVEIQIIFFRYTLLL